MTNSLPLSYQGFSGLNAAEYGGWLEGRTKEEKGRVEQFDGGVMQEGNKIEGGKPLGKKGT